MNNGSEILGTINLDEPQSTLPKISIEQTDWKNFVDSRIEQIVNQQKYSILREETKRIVVEQICTLLNRELSGIRLEKVMAFASEIWCRATKGDIENYEWRLSSIEDKIRALESRKAKPDIIHIHQPALPVKTKNEQRRKQKPKKRNR